MSPHESYESQLDESGLFSTDAPEDTPAPEFIDPLDPADELDGEADETSPPEYSPFLPHPVGGNGMLLFGGLAFATSIALAGLTISENTTTLPVFDQLGISPFAVCLFGVAFMALAMLRRNQDLAANRLVSHLASVQDTLDYVSSRAEATPDREDFAELPVLLQRIDEKISNLSKATKMYGKPLIDVANQMQEAANHLSEIEGSLDSVVEQVHSSSRQLGHDLNKLIEASDATGAFPREEFDQLTAAVRRGTSLTEEIKLEIETAPDQAERQQIVEEISSIRSDIRSVTTSLESLRTTIRSAPPPAPAAPQPASPTVSAEQAAEASTPPPTPAAAAQPAATPQSTPSPSPASAAPSADPAIAQSIAGERKTTGKNVLGAIAKLKQMRN